jgi:hypothetical protein
MPQVADGWSYDARSPDSTIPTSSVRFVASYFTNSWLTYHLTVRLPIPSCCPISALVSPLQRRSKTSRRRLLRTCGEGSCVVVASAARGLMLCGGFAVAGWSEVNCCHCCEWNDSSRCDKTAWNSIERRMHKSGGQIAVSVSERSKRLRLSHCCFNTTRFPYPRRCASD